jgi:hypothetical protein
VTTNFWASTFITWEADFDKEYWGAIDVHLADSVVLENNFVAGAERVGIYLKGDLCPGDSLGKNYNHSIRNNTVYSSLAGVAVLPGFTYSPNLTCVTIRNFTIFKASHYGIYYQNPLSIFIDSNVLVDNQVNIFLMVIQPPLLAHEMAYKKMVVNKAVIVGESSSFNCTNDSKPNDLNFQHATSITAIVISLNDQL